MKVDTLEERLLFTTTPIVTDTARSGTGFFVTYEVEGYEGGPSLFLVTNKHVIEGSSKCEIRFTRSKASFIEGGAPGPDEPIVGDIVRVEVKSRWYGHPRDDVDVAIMPVFKDLFSVPGYHPFIKAFSPSHMNLEDPNSPNVAQDIVFAGYPEQLHDTGSNLPIIRSGITATHPDVDYRGLPVFLIDGSVFPGSSGSPVVILHTTMRANRERRYTTRYDATFLGILASVYTSEMEVTQVGQLLLAGGRPSFTARQMMDLGIVFKARTIFETIERALYVARRMREEGIVPAVLDDGTIMEDFEQLKRLNAW